jgi:hypothetical protein
MASYTVHEPPAKRRPERRGPERFVFVRDGFYFWAFLLTPIWMLWRRLWLVFFGWIAVSALLILALRLVGASTGAQVGALALLAFLVGLEAGSLRRWTLRRRKWIDLGAVTADSLEAAERRFFDAWTSEDGPARGSVASSSGYAPSVNATYGAPSPRQSAGPDVVGLFPEPGTGR